MVKGSLPDSVLTFLYSRFARPGESKNGLGANNRVLLFASPRGGSTWLSEILGSIPASVVIEEPFKKGKVSRLSQLGFTWHQPIPENADWPAAHAALQDILDIRYVPRNLFSLRSALQLRNKEYFIFKLCYANLMMPWLLRHFESKAILLVRHPCAVVASQLQHPAWMGIPELPRYRIPECRYGDLLEPYQDALQKIDTKAGFLAWWWAVTTDFGLQSARKNPAVLVTCYEALITDFASELQRIFNYLDQPITPHQQNLYAIPSKTSSSSLLENIANDAQLTHWKTMLTQQQVKSILRVVNECGVSLYSENPEPDYGQIQ